MPRELNGKKTSAKISIKFSHVSYELAFLRNPSTTLRDLSGDARLEMEINYVKCRPVRFNFKVIYRRIKRHKVFSRQHLQLQLTITQSLLANLVVANN